MNSYVAGGKSRLCTFMYTMSCWTYYYITITTLHCFNFNGFWSWSWSAFVTLNFKVWNGHATAGIVGLLFFFIFVVVVVVQ